MAHYIFSDIHGCIDELRDLYALAVPQSSDTIVIAGDLVDKGPDSAAVVRFFRELSLNQKVILVCGNHEYKHARYRRNLTMHPAGAQSMLERNGGLAVITNQLLEADIVFLDSAKLLYYLPDGKAVVLHAGVTPNTRVLPKGDAPWSREDIRVLYVRWIDAAGSMVRLGDERSDSRFWADIYDGRFGHIFFGHEPFIHKESPVRFQYATGLDLGCVFGGHLACARYDAGDIQYFTVKARSVYVRARSNMEEM